MSPTLLVVVFGIVFLAELPDKTALASLVLGTRYRPGVVLIGVAAAFAVQVIIAVAAGSVLSLAPRRIVDAVVAALFLAGAVLMLRRGTRHDDDDVSAATPARPGPDSGSTSDERENPGAMTVLLWVRGERAPRRSWFWRVVATSFGVVFVAELGDLTQITIANLAAKYDDPLTVGVGAVLGLWAVSGLAVLGGWQLLRWIPLTWIARVAALVMIGLSVLSAVAAITG